MNRPSRRTARTLHRSALVTIAVFLAGCVQTPDAPASDVVQDEYLAGPAGEPVELSYTFPGDDRATERTAELVDGVVLIEGDIALGRYDELTAMGELTPHAHGIATSYWPASTATPPYAHVIPYVVSDDFSQSYLGDVIEPAIEHRNESTAIEFVPRNGEADNVEFVTVNNRCWSAVGRQVVRQEIRLDENACTRIATVVHELGHTVGLKHEQQRTDRDDIQTNPDRSGNFRLFGPGLPLGEYGYTSIMHDSRTAFGQVDENGNRMTTVRTLGDTIRPANRLTDDDQPKTDVPLYPGIWRLDDPDDGTIIGMGLQSSTKLGPGPHTVYVEYGSASDSVTVSVQEAGTPPTATISSPADESVFDWLALDGVDSFQRRGMGTDPVLRFPMSVNTVRSDVRLTAVDSDGMTDSVTIQIAIVWPPS